MKQLILSKYLREAKEATLRVEFIETVEEYQMYYKALYEAMMWGRKVK